MQGVSDNPPKKPVATVGFDSKIYLRSALSHTLSKFENEPKPLDKEQWEKDIRRLRELLSMFRKAGFAWRPVMAFAGASAICIVLVLASLTRRTFYYSYPTNYLRVIQNLDPCLPDGSCGYRFLMQLVQDGVPQEPTQMHFCKGLQPRFEQGHTLKYIVYANLGSCHAIERFDLVRENGIATLAANCEPDYSVAREFGHIACEGGKARF